MNKDYLRQKLYLAMLGLGASGKTLKERLISAYEHHLLALGPNIPQNMPEFSHRITELDHLMTQRGASENGYFNAVRNTVQQMTNKEKLKAAEAICGLVLLLDKEERT